MILRKKVLVVLLALCAGFFMANGQAAKKASAPLKKFEKSMIPKDAFVFFVIGDWGRNGEIDQSSVAASMKKCAEMADPEFFISTGDNFYTYGVASVDDPQWMSSFENVYKGNAFQIDWYAILGNHDYRGSAQAQIDYTKKSRRWIMPAAYFTKVHRTDNDQKVRFIFMDTNPFVKKYYKEIEDYPELARQDTTKQWKWVDSVFAASATNKEEWKIVVGHHPVYSSSKKHGDTKELHSTLKPRLESNKVQAYICGHDHDLQHQKPKGSYVDYFLSGAGAEVRPTASYEHTLFAESIPGFAIVSISGDVLTLYYVDNHGNVVYTYSRTR